MPLFIYTNNVEDNIKIIKNYTKKKIMAVVKSDAYGLGANTIIKTLKKAKVNYFVFEKYKEYLQSVEVIENANVLIMESISLNQIQQEKNYNVAYTINSYIDAIKIKDINKKIKIHIRVDTGMNRFGIRNIEEFKKIINILKTNENIYLEGLYTHFSSPLLESNYYEKQRIIFQKYTNLYNFPIIHANATKTLHKKLIGNYVRIGMAMYGYHQPFINLKPTISLLERPVNVFKATKANKIGYSQLKTNKVVGVLPIGYNEVDLSTVKYIRLQELGLKNQKLKLFGKSCMNHTHFIGDDKINYLSWLSILPNNGIIVGSDDYVFPRQEDWYKILTSMKKLPKTYVRRSNYDLPKIFNYRGQKGLYTRFRKRGNQIIDSRII